MSTTRRNGGDWIRLAKRLAIYHRDDFDCVYCRGVFPVDSLGYGLTLDHVKPDGGNDATNLVTACNACNVGKGTTPLACWLEQLCECTEQVAAGLLARVKAQTAKPIDRERGVQLAKQRRPFYCVGNYVNRNVPGGGRRPMRETA